MVQMKKCSWMALLLALVMITGCSKIYFHNGPSENKPMPDSEFHDIGIFGLVEFSKPVNLKAECGEKNWESVETVNGFLTGLVTAVTYGLYSPWGYAVSCK